ncbi:MAG: hypothetical protein ACYSUY_17800 [Planctomycetota bacterium]
MILLQGNTEKWILGGVGKTNPIQTQYKPNSNPIQTQYKPNSKPIKAKTNPIQTQTKPISEAKTDTTFFTKKD